MRTNSKSLMLAGLLASSVPAQVNAALPSWAEQLSPVTVLAGLPKQRFGIADRMAFYRVPAVSVAVIEKCRVAGAYAFGARTPGGPAITPRTQFQAASISKTAAAIGALKLVDHGRLSLDEDVRGAIPGWTATGAGATKPLSLRQLLSHTGGTNVSGFPGYALSKPVPTLEQVLNGEPPANTPAIKVERNPGSKFGYSGGGYTLVQALMSARSRADFATLMRTEVLEPLRMRDSSFDQVALTSAKTVDRAAGHDKNGHAVEGGWHIYPELAAAGLWSTPTDLAKLGIAIMSSARGDPGSILRQSTAKEMLRRQEPAEWGLGVELQNQDGAGWFKHSGQNQGYLSVLIGFPSTCSGMTVVANGEGGGGLIKEVVNAISRQHGWPETVAARTLRRLDRAEITRVAGRYVVANPPVKIEIRQSANEAEFLINGIVRGQVLADTLGDLVVASPDLEIRGAIEPASDGGLTVVIGDRRLAARRASADQP